MLCTEKLPGQRDHRSGRTLRCRYPISETRPCPYHKPGGPLSPARVAEDVRAGLREPNGAFCEPSVRGAVLGGGFFTLVPIRRGIRGVFY